MSAGNRIIMLYKVEANDRIQFMTYRTSQV